ncbi:hypothetical protein CONPUDRAFT_141735 [Coniophora puteana RWD-64-598 SS2]|uniref:Ribosomal protein mS38 C-terminal domain-containing protein n=1 Tax=Coniophora puteana (strain RWD-64-598) TaxID=741705 RepID=A0A5M3N1N6_CONPW|nr:uncharacterized protein CONPUDRAFT_141735 [Coniophora puteana RWD-64-598 SS2]EIW84934.1 hypothetical protein CONPUDRAFT_141735 [Coniophora puteana RWD-64-598 SS2]
MSLLPRLARPSFIQRRAYSSYFSSKTGGGGGGGGRYFTSAKPPKPVVSGRGGAKVESSSSPASKNDASGSPTSQSNDSPNTAQTGASEETAKVPTTLSSSDGPTRAATASASKTSSPPMSHQPQQLVIPPHISLSMNDLKTHQFFSLHRPMLLLQQPTSMVFDSPDPSIPLFGNSPKEQKLAQDLHSSSLFGEIPESSVESDADTARQLAHSMVLNRVGNAMSWQETLQRLGLDSAQSADTISAKESAEEWITIHADSTRRKKRTKMKKHKLKKRRRLTRIQRQNAR